MEYRFRSYAIPSAYVVLVIGIISTPTVPDIPTHRGTGARAELRQSRLLRSSELVFDPKVGLGSGDLRSFRLFGCKLVVIVLSVLILVV